MIGDGFLFLTALSNGGAFIMGGGVMEPFDSLLTATDNWGVVFMILVARVLMVLVATPTW